MNKQKVNTYDFGSRYIFSQIAFFSLVNLFGEKRKKIMVTNARIILIAAYFNSFYLRYVRVRIKF